MHDSKRPLKIHAPSGKNASYKDMRHFGSILQKLVSKTETQLKKEKNTKRYNETVNYLNFSAHNDNQEPRAFKQEQKQLVSFSMLIRQNHQ